RGNPILSDSQRGTAAFNLQLRLGHCLHDESPSRIGDFIVGSNRRITLTHVNPTGTFAAMPAALLILGLVRVNPRLQGRAYSGLLARPLLHAVDPIETAYRRT
ncbi:hypothetical protein, partial [Paraburkholderia sp. UYCP14C]|uniref:hypothetical protein n=1 Tax=Paraburkholderia sp. UYCP14C TaxID=2511130 RepID=UPI001B7D5EF4